MRRSRTVSFTTTTPTDYRKLTEVQHENHDLVVSTSHAISITILLEVLIVHGHRARGPVCDRLIGLKACSTPAGDDVPGAGLRTRNSHGTNNHNTNAGLYIRSGEPSWP